MFAGRTASRKRINAIPAMRRVRGTNSPIAPRISAIPVNVTINSGFGTKGGTIATMSGRVLLKCAAAVKRNITASPTRVAAAQSRRRATPKCPINLARSVTTTRTISGAMAVSSLVTVFATLDLRLHRHEQAAAFTLYLVSDDFSRIVALADAPGAPRRGHELALPELEHTRRIRIVERSQRI